MTTRPKHLALIAGLLGALIVVILLFRGGSAGIESPPALAAAPTLAPTVTFQAAATPFALPTDQPSLLALGRRLVASADARPVARDFEVETASYADGSTFLLAGDGPGPIIVVYFMAAWCPTCGPEAVALGDLHERYRDTGLRILIVDVDQDETEEDLARFREQTGGGEHLWAMDRDFMVARALEVNTLDATVVLDQQGRIAYRDGSPTDYGTLAAVVEVLLEEGGASTGGR